MSTPVGRDGRPLVPTAMAAYSLGTTPAGFRSWAKRRGITPATYRATGNAGHPQAWWDLADIADVVRTKGNAA
ncbi:hypothetical protein U9R90_06245 [Streptomyces sp. E11-3]|uniref:hypothetical protein n=1 Tax=Streptomyces sp. E11-3 TaxID=3110112 RepID=UPI0039808489